MNDTDKIKCPCCGETYVKEWDICENCEWQHDLVHLEDPDYVGGPNQMSLNEARKAYREGKQVK